MFHGALFSTIVRCRLVKVVLVLMWFLPADFLQAASAPPLNGRQNEILHTAMVANGYVTPALHREFWSMFPDDVRNDASFLAYSERKLAALYRYHHEVVASARLSLAAKTVVMSPGYAAAKTELEFDREGFILPDRTVIHGEALIGAAASGKVRRDADGFVLADAQRVDDLAGALDGSLARLQILLRPDWRAVPQEYVYSEASIAIMSVAPFTRKRRIFKLAAPPFAPVTLLSQQLDEDRFVAVASVTPDASTNALPKNKSAALMAVLEQVLSHYDAALGERPRVKKRHGDLSIKTAVYIISADANNLVVARAFYRKDGQIIVLLSRSRQVTARANFDALAHAIRFLADGRSRQ